MHSISHLVPNDVKAAVEPNATPILSKALSDPIQKIADGASQTGNGKVNESASQTKPCRPPRKPRTGRHPKFLGIVVQYEDDSPEELQKKKERQEKMRMKNGTRRRTTTQVSYDRHLKSLDRSMASSSEKKQANVFQEPSPYAPSPVARPTSFLANPYTSSLVAPSASSLVAPSASSLVAPSASSLVAPSTLVTSSVSPNNLMSPNLQFMQFPQLGVNQLFNPMASLPYPMMSPLQYPMMFLPPMPFFPNSHK